MTTYDHLSDLVNQGRLNFIVIVAPPRTGSTMLQSVLARSQSVSVGINDPQKEDFKQIYNEASKALANQDTATVVVKEMSHWIYSEDYYKNLFGLTDKIVFSVRNPLLSTESRIRKFVDALTLKPTLEIQQWIRKYISTSNVADYTHWDIRRDSLTNEDDISGLGDNDIRSKELADQKRLLDGYAETMRFSNWENMKEVSYQRQNYKGFGALLNADSSENGFAVEQLGWGALSEEAQYVRQSGKEPIIIDNTDLRLEPERISRELCRKLGIQFDYAMINGWNNQEFARLVTETTPESQQVQSLWYDTLSQSEGIKPPTERPPKLNDFPEQVRDYIQTTAFPVYLDQFMSTGRIRSEGQIAREFSARTVDPIFSILSESRGLSKESLLNLVLTSGDVPEGDFNGRRK